ncbi:MAG: hypothetical protein HYS38_01570 [Acidobacteria bacterium]|nr:hypothetical protein [Acidobacteriota bacterium]
MNRQAARYTAPPPLSPAALRLVGMMTGIGFGRIEQLCVRNGQPTFDPPPLVTRTIKLGPSRSYIPLPLEQAAAQPEVRQLLAEIASLRTGVIERVEIRDGHPVFLEIANGALRQEAGREG